MGIIVYSLLWVMQDFIINRNTLTDLLRPKGTHYRLFRLLGFSTTGQRSPNRCSIAALRNEPARRCRARNLQGGQDLGFRVQGFGFRVWGLGFRVWVQGSASRV